MKLFSAVLIVSGLLLFAFGNVIGKVVMQHSTLAPKKIDNYLTVLAFVLVCSGWLVFKFL